MRDGSMQAESLPAPVPESGVLYLHAARGETERTLRHYLQTHSFTFYEPGPQVICVPLTPGLLRGFAQEIAQGVPSSVLDETRCLIVNDDNDRADTDFLHMRPLRRIVAEIRNEWFVNLLRDDRFTTHFHPIVGAHPPHDIYAYECLLRGDADTGELIPPVVLFRVAREIGLLERLDRQARLNAIRDTVRHRIATNVFINLNPLTMRGLDDKLASTVEAISKAGLSPERFVFEVVESDAFDDIDRLTADLTPLRQRGFRFALDDFGTGYNNLHLMTRLRPDFIKLSMDLIRDVDRDPYKSRVARKVLEMAKGLGVGTVIEGVERRGEWDWVKANGADYAQGFYFARPESRPPAVAC